MSKWPPVNIQFVYISGYKPPNLLSLVPNYTFAGTRIPLRALQITLADLVMAAIFNFNMAANHIVLFLTQYARHIQTVDLVSRPMFPGSWNPLRAVLILFANLVKTAILNVNMSAIEKQFVLHISGSKPPNLLNLVSNPTSSGTWNPLRALLIILADLVLAATFNFKMTVNEIVFCLYLSLHGTY
jgi:hypothetical protein